MTPRWVNKLSTFRDHGQPRTVGQLNGHDLMVAREEVHILLIEPAGTPNTGDPATAAARGVI
ncbi:MAG TPA: hypothetical protein VNC82_12730 [Candidatus Limnocylindria bacterium]|nr:hypothetical protein [Candidatus Limnocylindria bacterium]